MSIHNSNLPAASPFQIRSAAERIKLRNPDVDWDENLLLTCTKRVVELLPHISSDFTGRVLDATILSDYDNRLSIDATTPFMSENTEDQKKYKEKFQQTFRNEGEVESFLADMRDITDRKVELNSIVIARLRRKYPWVKVQNPQKAKSTSYPHRIGARPRPAALPMKV